MLNSVLIIGIAVKCLRILAVVSVTVSLTVDGRNICFNKRFVYNAILTIALQC